MFPYSTSSSSDPCEEAIQVIKFLLTLIPGWVRNPDPFLVQPGHTIEYENEVARRVKEIEDKYNPPPPPPPDWDGSEEAGDI